MGTFRADRCTFVIIFRLIIRKKKCFRKIVEKIKIRIVFNNNFFHFSKIVPFIR